MDVDKNITLTRLNINQLCNGRSSCCSSPGFCIRSIGFRRPVMPATRHRSGIVHFNRHRSNAFEAHPSSRSAEHGLENSTVSKTGYRRKFIGHFEFERSGYNLSKRRQYTVGCWGKKSVYSLFSRCFHFVELSRFRTVFNCLFKSTDRSTNMFPSEL